MNEKNKNKKNKNKNDKVFYRIAYCLVEIIGACIVPLDSHGTFSLQSTKIPRQKHENCGRQQKRLKLCSQCLDRQKWHGENDNRKIVRYLLILSSFFGQYFLVGNPLVWFVHRLTFRLFFFSFFIFHLLNFRIIYYVSIRIVSSLRFH